MRSALSVGGLLLLLASVSAAAETDQLIGTLKAVRARGAAHDAAVVAQRELSQQGPEALVPILEALKRANPLAANWLRGAFETIAQRAVADDALPAAKFEAFIRDTNNEPKARRLAYEWLIKVQPSAADELIPGMLEDPASEFRRDAVARLIDQAKQADSGQRARALYKHALTGAVDQDQVDQIAAALEEYGEPVNLRKHFGFLTDWHLIGPFDNRDEAGFAVAYPPEHELDLEAEYDGMAGPVQWEKYTSQDEYGVFDLAKLTEPHKGACTYATTAFESDRRRDVEFRLATPNAWKLWLNGELLFAREEYHRGMRFDQYRVEATLKEGKNTLLLKVCQNEQDQPWAQDWQIQFRVTEPSGKAVPSTELTQR